MTLLNYSLTSMSCHDPAILHVLFLAFNPTNHHHNNYKNDDINILFPGSE